jgi:hypothetical protein
MGNLVSQDELSDDLLNLLIAQTGSKIQQTKAAVTKNLALSSKQSQCMKVGSKLYFSCK